MELTAIYECFSDPTRLRILNLLLSGPLCVCHFQKVLNEPQVKISKHLSYLKSHGLVTATRAANWMVYRLPSTPSTELRANLACLRRCARQNPLFCGDAARLSRLRAKFDKDASLCCVPKAVVVASRPRSKR